jgi:hypothetical protein
MNELLSVPYFSQIDNDSNLFGLGSRQCCMTSNAMAADFILTDNGLESLTDRAKRKNLSEPESAYGQILNQYGDTTDHAANTQALAELGLESYFSTSLSIDNAIASLDKRLPMPIGLHYKNSGHIVCLVGYNLSEKRFFVHDPYGRRAGAEDYYDVIGGDSGKYDSYSFDLMQRLWANPADGWGRVFTKIAGKSTGM